MDFNYRIIPAQLDLVLYSLDGYKTMYFKE
jgi:hypothetical protein